MAPRHDLHHPPGPFGLPLLGVLPRFRKNPAEFLLNTAAEFGDVSYFRLGLQHVYLLNRPDLIQEVLVTNQGNFTKSRMMQRARYLLGDGLLTAEGSMHLQHRRMLQPAFSQERLAQYAAAMVECAERARSRWRDGQQLDIDREMMRLTLEVVGFTLFGKDVGEDFEQIGSALTDVIATFGLMLTPGASIWQHLPFPVMLRAKKARLLLDAVVQKIIADRRANPRDQGDLLSMLLAAEEDNNRLTDEQVRDHVLTFLLAGHETTATALTWTWYLLASNPDVDQKMRAEIDAVLGTRAPGYADLARLEYTGRVFAEALRLYPPAWALGRKSRNAMRLYNHHVAAGSICILSPYVTHRHPRLWPDPERFDPDRFLPDQVASRPSFSYFPFGGGTRTCIGERFATMEGLLLLASIAQRWRFRLDPGQRVEVQPLITLRPRYGMKMTAVRVHD